MATIKRRGDRGNRWEVRYRDPEGTQKARLFDRKVDAERFVTGVDHSILIGGYVDPAAGKVTFHAFAEEWRHIQVHRANTAQSAEQQLRLHVYPAIGHRPIAAIRPSEVQGLVQRLATTLAPSTVEVIYGRVVAVFRAAVRDRIVTTSPCIDIRKPAKPPASMLEVLSRDQVFALAETMPERVPGVRAGRRRHRPQARRTVRAHRRSGGLPPAVDPGRPPARSGPRRGGGTRAAQDAGVVPEGAARSCRGRRPGRHLSQWPAHAEAGLIFTNERGAAIQQSPFAVVFGTAARRAGLPQWATPHDLRHYFASVLIRSGASVKVVQARLGHSSAKTTLDVYGHLFADEEDRTRAAIDAKFASRCAPDVHQRGGQIT